MHFYELTVVWNLGIPAIPNGSVSSGARVSGCLVSKAHPRLSSCSVRLNHISDFAVFRHRPLNIYTTPHNRKWERRGWNSLMEASTDTLQRFWNGTSQIHIVEDNWCMYIRGWKRLNSWVSAPKTLLCFVSVCICNGDSRFALSTQLYMQFGTYLKLNVMLTNYIRGYGTNSNAEYSHASLWFAVSYTSRLTTPQTGSINAYRKVRI